MWIASILLVLRQFTPRPRTNTRELFPFPRSISSPAKKMSADDFSSTLVTFVFVVALAFAVAVCRSFRCRR